jgi:molybdate transport system substrate-binding protein
MRPVQFNGSRESSRPAAARSARRRCIVAMLVLFGLGTSGALAGEIRILAAVAVQDPLERLATAFAQATGHKVDIGYGLTGPILADIKAGKPVDAVVLPEAGVTGLEDAGLLLSRTPVAASLAGVGVQANAPLPDVSSLEKFIALLRAAPSVSYTDPKSGGAFGQSFDRTLVELGLASEVRRKALLVSGSQQIVVAVARGEAAVAITFKSAIVTTPGLKFAGMLPPPFKNQEPFTAGMLKTATSPDIARAFIGSLLTPEARAIWNELGFVPAGVAAR